MKMISTLSESRNVLELDARRLRDLSEAAYTLGQDRLGEQLSDIAERINTELVLLREALTTDITMMGQRAEEASNNMLRACVAMAEVGR